MGGVVLGRKHAISLKRGKITIDDQYEVAYALSTGAKVNDLGWPWRAIMHSVSKHVRLSKLPRKFEWRYRPILSTTKMKPNDSRFWQYKVYADIRGGSQDLCKFSLDLHMPVSVYYYTGMVCRTRFQDHVFGGWSHLATNRAAGGVVEYRRDQRKCGKRSSGLWLWSAEYLESAEKNCGSFVGILTNKANFSI